MWLESYLSQRVQYVKFGQDVSSTTQLKTGVPQGSVLGPILFTSFISPIQFVTSQFNVDQQQYADDTQVFISLSKGNSPDRVSRLETALVHLTSWFYLNGLALNFEKSEAILLGTHPRNKSLDNITQVDVNGLPIPISDSIKLLGVTIDSFSCFQQTCKLDMPVLSVPHPSSSPHSSHPRHRQTGWTRFGELPTWLRQLHHVWHVEVPDG